MNTRAYYVRQHQFLEKRVQCKFQLQFKRDLLKNTIRNLTLATIVNLRKCVETVQEDTEIQKSALYSFHTKVDIEHSSTETTKCTNKNRTVWGFKRERTWQPLFSVSE
jgi:hypothetical protein